MNATVGKRTGSLHEQENDKKAARSGEAGAGGFAYVVPPSGGIC